MRYRLPFIILVALSITVSATAQGVCVKCIALNCESGMPAGYVNCGRNGTRCIQWTYCNSGGSPVATFQPSSVLVAPDASAWHLVAFETHSSRPSTPVWRLADATVHAADEPSAIRSSAVHR
jgi:hypothetical protein